MKKLLLSIVLFVFTATTINAAGHVANASGTNITCNGLCNGTASATASGGVGPYGYTWAGPSSYTASVANITGLCAGSYTVTAIDSSDMSTATYVLTLTQPAPLVATVNSGTICTGMPMTLVATATGGTSAYTYSWSPPGTLSSTTVANPLATPFTSTSYTVTIMDVNGCIGTAVSMVTVNPNPIVNVNSPTICAGQTAILTATGAFTYAWSTGAITNPLSVIPATTTTYTVTGNSLGCTGTAIATVTVAPAPVISLSPNPAFCGACNGSIVATAPGATTYSWVGPSGFTGATTNISALCPGTYTLTATNAMGCASSASTNIINAPPPTVAAGSVTNATCGACDGSANVVASSGNPPYSYLWSITGDTTASSVGLCAGAYTVTVTDVNGCTDLTLVVVNNSSGPSSAAITTTNTSCTSSTGQINIGAVTGGLAPYTYSVNGGAFTSTLGYTGLAAGTHSVAIKDANGCILNQLDTISLMNPPIMGLDSINGITCASGTTGNIFITTTAGSPPYSFSWSNGSASEDLANIGVYGNYTLTVSDVAGCIVNSTYYVSSAISVYGSVVSTPVNCSTQGTATVTPYGGTAPYTFLWNSIPAQTSAAATGLSPGVYNCIVSDAGGCSASVIVAVPNYTCSNVIKGKIYNDVNSNCIQDVGESGISGRTIIVMPGYHFATSDLNGDYTAYTTSMNNTVTVSTYLFPYYTSICPASAILNVNFSTLGDTITNNDFSYYVNPSAFNLGIHPGWTTANPGFSKNYWIIPINNSPTPQTALIRFVYDSNLVYNSSTMGGVHFPAQKKIEWTITLPSGGASLLWAYKPEANFTVPATMSITSSLTSYFEILPIAGDAFPPDNTLLVTEPVTGSRDPNAKSVIPEGVGPNGNIFQSDSVLFYTIHFQNNGNDTAHFVVVTDTLSSFLDPATVVPGASDHPYTFELSGDGIMNFRFDNIMLPDSTTDEPRSNGYFNYTVKVKTGTPVGSVINNTASIYFDYNEAVVTNTTINTIIDIAASVESMSTNSIIKVYPNPFSDNTTFVIHSDKLNEIYSFELTDVLGKKVKSLNGISAKEFEISRNGLENGIYFYKIYSSESIVGVGKIVIK